MNDIPLPFDLPPPAATLKRPARSTRVPSAAQLPNPGHHTDLPLPLSGNSGSDRRGVHVVEAATLRHLLDRLDRLLAIPAAPSLDDADWRAVRRWAEDAAEGLVLRREGLKLVRDVERVLAEQSRTAMQIINTNERVAQRLALAEERAAGTHWQRRDAGRRAKQPTHVEVDLAAWRRARSAAAKRGTTIGSYVGVFVRSAASDGLPPVDACATTEPSFARLDVDRSTWRAFKARCNAIGVSVARGVGVVVESAIALSG